MQTANLASCSKSILTHNSSTATPLQTYTHHRGLITCTVWNKNKSLASCGIDGKIILADKPGSIAFDVQFDLTKVVSVNSCAFSSNSRYIAAGGSDGLVKIWDMRRSEKEADLVLKSHIGAVTSVAWSRSDDIIASSSVSGDVVLNSVGNGDVVERFSCGKQEQVNMIRFGQDPTQNQLAACTNLGSVILWDITTRSPLCSFLKVHRSSATALSISSFNPVLMVSASLDQDLHFFDISLKRKVKTLKCEQSLTSVSFHSDGHTLAAGGVYGGLYVYDLRRLSEPKERLVGHDSAVSYVDFLKEKEPVTAKFTSVQAQNNPSTVITSTNPVQTKKQTPLSTMPVLIQKPVQRIIERPRPASKAQTTQPIIPNIPVTPHQLPPQRSTSNYMQPPTQSAQSPFVTKDSFNELSQRFNDFSQNLRSEITSHFQLMHLEIIRQFQIQQSIIEGMMREERRKDEYIKELEKENEKLRKVSY